MDIDALREWVGRSQTAFDVASASPALGLAALLDHETPPWPSGYLPPLAHWLHFLPRDRQSQIDIDGHPRRGGFLPPVPLPRRMWAGGRLEFLRAVPVGAVLERRSTIVSVEPKSGATGKMVFVVVRHEIRADGQLAVREEQDLVYRAAADPAPPPAAVPTTRRAEHERMISPDPVQLFRFSALTFNGHRIHYDRDYARDVEHYSGLVVQGPFIAVLLMDLLMRQQARPPTHFSFRARRPTLDVAPFHVCLSASSAGFDLWARDAEGQVTMTANAVLRQDDP